MVGWAEEAESAVELADGAVQKLHKIDPLNSLLWFWITPPEGQTDPFGGNEEKCRNAMKDRFWGRKKPWREEAGSIVTAVVVANYVVAVEKEITRFTVQREREL